MTAGRRRWTISSAAATCIAVGKVSFDDCDMFTWSLGWIGALLPRSPPASSMARFEITSLTFMFVWVPLPVCQTYSGNSSSCSPSMISSAAWTMSFASSAGSLPRSWLVSAAAFLRMAMPRMTAFGMRSSPMEK